MADKISKTGGPKAPACKKHSEPADERLTDHAFDELTQADLLTLLLTYTGACHDARRIVERTMGRFGDIKTVMNASAAELTGAPGFPRSAVALIRLVREFATIYNSESPPGDLLSNPRELERYLLTRLKGLKDEALLLVLMDQNGVVVGDEVLGAGTVNQLTWFPRQLMAVALQHNAAGVVMAHNHPHGPPLPSQRDREQAERMRELLLPFDIVVRDALVVGRNRCFSIFRNAPL